MRKAEIPPVGEERPLKVNERVIGHLSRGLYRSPASAMRELVSNAWDADATVVRINLNPPHFSQMTVSDNGRGFSLESFVKLMSGQIGNSEKRTSDVVSEYGRAVIGRLGIGMLGVGLICHSFLIASKTRDGKAWQARVRFLPDMKEALDSASDADAKMHKLDVGTFEIEDRVTVPLADTGTCIVADRLHPTFIETFSEAYTTEAAALSLDWKDLQSFFAKKPSLTDAGEYLRTVWEVAASAPLPYAKVQKNAPEPVIREQKRLLDAKFAVLMDGRRLYKPVDFDAWSNLIFYSIPSTTIEVFGSTLEFSGYFLARNGNQIKPDALRGILLRVRGVGIGSYDPSFLDYPVNEGPRTRWITAEVFVEKGLEEALNIDRDSFNRFDPAYRELAKRIHQILQGKVISDLNRKQKERNQRRQEAKASKENKGTSTKQNASSPTSDSSQDEQSHKNERGRMRERIVLAFKEFQKRPDGLEKFEAAVDEILRASEV